MSSEPVFQNVKVVTRVLQRYMTLNEY